MKAKSGRSKHTRFAHKTEHRASLRPFLMVRSAWKPSFTAFVLVLVLVLDLDLVRETMSSSRSTSTGETPEYEYDRKTPQKAAFTIQSDAGR